MNRFLIRLFLVAVLLCDFLGSAKSARVQDIAVADEQRSEEQIKQNDGYLKAVAEEPQGPVEVAFRSSSSSHRVASHRSTRLLPTHGGKPTNQPGRWAKDNSYNPQTHALLLSCCCHCWQCTTVASQRLRYVIALRRLLC